MFHEISVKELKLNPMNMFGDDWLALTAGNEEHGYNTMCIAWGHMGSLWERDSHANRLPTVTCFVRPQRYTKEFMDRENLFTVSHFPPSTKKALGFIGSHSGRDTDKVKEAGLTPAFACGTTWFEEADMVLICRKLYQSPLCESGFIDKGLIEFNYPKKDFHEMYIGEILKVLVKEA